MHIQEADGDGGGEGADPSDLSALRAKLRRLMAEDAEAVLDFQVPEPAGSTKAAVGHRQRTARYKSQQLLALAPDSQAVAQACTYLVLWQLERRGREEPHFRRHLIESLTSAGYERDQVESTLDRLAIGVLRRRSMWQRGQIRKIATALAAAIRPMKER